jgi:hypothetical protein
VHPGVVCGDRPGTVLREAGHENTFVKAGTGDPDMATEATLAEWIDYVFDHPVEDPAWHFSIDSPRLDPAPARSRFPTMGAASARYTDWVIGRCSRPRRQRQWTVSSNVQRVCDERCSPALDWRGPDLFCGESLIRDRRWEEAETALRQALRIAREQQAQGFELRVAASLDRLQAVKSSQPSER